MKKFADKGTAGRNIIKRPQCPFCGMSLERPRELETRRPGEMPVGSCEGCGAVYAFDATGRNLGATFIEALVFGCDMDWDLAWNLTSGEDYLEGLLENYDLESNYIVPGGFFEGRKIPGALYFVRLQKDIQEATAGGVKRNIDRAAGPLTVGIPENKKSSRRYTKKEIEEIVASYHVGQLLKAAGQDKKIIRILQRLLCSDDLTRLRSAEFIGRAAAIIARTDPGTVTVLLQNLFGSLADTGSANRGALDAIGEIIGGCPNVFIGYMPALYHFLEESDKRPQVVRALARIAETRPDLVNKTVFRLLPYLQDPDPETRGYTALLLGYLGVPEAKNHLEPIAGDGAGLNVYISGQLEKRTVGHLAREALERISSKEWTSGRETGDGRRETE
ncbi:MAG: HEAT repeat domain-containing protein [Actinobacteria bacterium]|nr:HEAT repeat domain-containing protein [Actinomycetota bacterium]